MDTKDDGMVVGIGASAGGIQAIKRFFEHVPRDSGIAYVVILHLSPDHESQLAEVLQVSTAIPVTQVRGPQPVEPDHVYVISPQQTLSIEDGYLKVSAPIGIEERRAPVDIFFRTLAASHGSRSVCVVLSGTGANGSMGLKRIKEQGGLCLVQDPEEAEYDDMPRNSIATGHADHVLPVAAMPAKIMGYRKSLRAVRLPEEAAKTRQPDELALRDIFSQLRARTGHDFSNYKLPTMLRRIARRMGVHEVHELAGYARYIREHPDEMHALLKDLLISVTSFFRDRAAFEVLERMVVPELFSGKAESDQVRTWVAGCATGEEAYSMAMLLAERARHVPGSASVQVFATDLDQAAIAVAREGLYTINDAVDVSPERLHRFFTREGSKYRVRKELREMVLFAHHNILKDPPFSHLDLICCRNLLIYLNRVSQQRVMQVAHFALNPGGYLFLGSSESVESGDELFEPLDKDAFLFQRRAVAATGLAMPVPEVALPIRGGALPASDRAAHERRRERLSTADLHQRLLELYAPPSVVVDEQHEIVHLSEHAGQYLLHPGGEPTLNLLKAVRPELRLELRTALDQAAQARTSVQAPGLTIRIGEQPVTVTIVVKPVLSEGDPGRGLFLVLFEEAPAGAVPAGREPVAEQMATSDAARHLEQEGVRLRAQLRATSERHDTQAEELRASNEELQAMNEELRSSSEELETSREELQSLNEELRTVNQQLKLKVEEQAQANDDIKNLINSTEIATIFLDRSSRIKLYTPPARELFTLIPADVGRPLSDISTSLVDAELEPAARQVLERLERVEREVTTRDGRWQWMRALPYRTTEDRIGGVVLTFLDITERKRAEERLRGSEGRLRLLVESLTDYAIFTVDAEGRIDSWNPGAARLFGYSDHEAIGMDVANLFTPQDRAAEVPQNERRAAALQGQAADERWHLRKDGSRFFASGVTAPLRADGAGTPPRGFVKIARDLTERKQWEDALTRAHADLEFRVQERTAQLGAVNTALDRELSDRRQATEQIRALMRRLITVQEDERQRIARDLHDQLGQEVAGLRLKLTSLNNAADDTLQPGLDEALRTLDRLDRALDFYIWELRPAALDDLGLVSTLGKYVREWSKEFGIEADFHSGGLDGIRLPYETEINLYRITQEALNNIHKHAKASHAAVMLEQRDSNFLLVIEDDGVGFDRGQIAQPGLDRGIGLVGMQERTALFGGTLEIETSPGEGTTIFVRVPLPGHEPRLPDR